MIAFFTSFWPAIAGGVVSLLAIAFAFLNKKSADTKVAQSLQAQAEARAHEAQIAASEATANAAASAAGAKSVKERQSVENDVRSLPAGSAAEQLRSDWSTGPSGSPDSHKDR